jgi:hypothetical protein
MRSEARPVEVRLVFGPTLGSRQLEAFWGRFHQLYVSRGRTGTDGPRRKVPEFELVHKAAGGRPVKSLKVEAAKTSNRSVRK